MKAEIFPRQARRRRVRFPVRADVARLFADRPYLPVVKFDPGFASWQRERQRNPFDVMREAIRRAGL